MVGSYPLSSLAPTPVEVELGCDNIVFVGVKPIVIGKIFTVVLVDLL